MLSKNLENNWWLMIMLGENYLHFAKKKSISFYNICIHVERTWVWVQSSTFLRCSSSFSSTLRPGRKVRDVRSSMSKFGELFELVWAHYWDNFWSKNILSHRVLLTSLLFKLKIGVWIMKKSENWGCCLY